MFGHSASAYGLKECRHHHGLSGAKQFGKMLDHAGRAVGALAMGPWLALLDKTVADQEVSDRNFENALKPEIGTQLDPQRERCAETQRTVEEHMPVGFAWK